MIWRAILLACLVVGCTRDPEEASPEPEPEPATDPEPAAEPEPEPEAAPSEPPALDRAARLALRHDRRRARALSSEGDHDAAWTLFARMIARSPMSPQLRCEGGSVARRAGRLDAARTELDHGLGLMGALDRVHPGLRVTAAQCLYDRGRVHEARAQTADARRAYEASLALRDNDIVRERLDGLAEVEAQVVIMRGQTLDDLVARVRELGCENPEETPNVEVVRELEEPRAAWLRSTCDFGQYGIRDVSHMLARRVEGGWRVEEPYRLMDGGRYYALSLIRAEDISELEQLERGGERALAVRTHIRTEEGYEDLELYPPDDEDVDCTGTEMTALDRRHLILCMNECRSLTMGQESTQESTLSCAVPDGDDYREIEPPEWAGGTPGESESSRWSISLRWDDQGRAEVRVREGEPPAEIQRLVGTPMGMRALFDAMTPLREMGDNAW